MWHFAMKIKVQILNMLVFLMLNFFVIKKDSFIVSFVGA